MKILQLIKIAYNLSLTLSVSHLQPLLCAMVDLNSL
ncbi:hypothetical protein CF65_02386 [Aggregatibacter actinomycetemcomitans HK1651]|nr:hypothetical protein CF65_02386 [Aggregatibacter actinomycetemcomitans HK1651]